MNLKQVYEAVLIELNKENAPSFTLDEFNYFANKGVIQTFNMNYGLADMNQQYSDNLRALKRNIVLSESDLVAGFDNKFILPSDYFHILNCIAVFDKTIPSVCANKNTVSYSCRRYTADNFAGIINNYYFKPDVKRPYFKLDYDNKIEIKFGDSNKYKLVHLAIEYVKYPDILNLTQEQVDSYEGEELSDPIQILDYPDYMCYEIINTILKLLLENTSNPRVQTNIPINQSIIPPHQSK